MKSWGLLRRRECLVPTGRGWLLALCLLGAAVVLLARGSYRFLAVNAPVSGGVLVVEGWMGDESLRQVAARFQQGSQPRLFVTGGPLDKGAPLSEYNTFAELGAATLLRLGLATNQVQAVPAPKVRADRTYASAVALGDWLRQQASPETRFNVVSVGPHARRTRLLYEKALGARAQVGIIALEDPSYDWKRWWTASAGVRAVIDETVAYGYARLFFWPRRP